MNISVIVSRVIISVDLVYAVSFAECVLTAKNIVSY